MSTPQPYTDRALKLTKRIKNGTLQIVGLLRRTVLPHIPKDDPSHMLKKPCIAKMKQHPIPLVRLGPNVFEKKNTVLLDTRSIRRAKRFCKNRKTSPRYQTLRLPCPQNTKPIRFP